MTIRFTINQDVLTLSVLLKLADAGTQLPTCTTQKICRKTKFVYPITDRNRKCSKSKLLGINTHIIKAYPPAKGGSNATSSPSLKSIFPSTISLFMANR